MRDPGLSVQSPLQSPKAWPLLSAQFYGGGQELHALRPEGGLGRGAAAAQALSAIQGVNHGLGPGVPRPGSPAGLQGGRPHEGAAEVVGGVKKNEITRLAKQTGFQQRHGRLTPYDFLVLLTLGQLGLPHPSLGGMVAAVSSRISREALHQRFTASATAFLRHCLHTVLRHTLQPVPIRTHLLQPFARVLLVDSSSWDVSEKLSAVLPGSGATPLPPIVSSKRCMTTSRAT
ncbi:MAG: hypothetical protein WD032_01470 [Nitrospirales bacterium]